MTEDYIKAVVGRIADKAAAASLKSELESHLADKTEYYIELGYDRETAERRAVEEMGEPDDAGMPLGALHRRREKPLFLGLSIAAELAVFLFYIFLNRRFSYAGYYYLGVYHALAFDLISMGAIILILTILFLARRKKSVGVTLSVVLLLILISGFEVVRFKGSLSYSLFQPALYGAITLFREGFGGLCDSVFAYMYIPQSTKDVLEIGSMIIHAVLLALSVSQFFILRRKEKMRPTKIGGKIVDVFCRCCSVILAANLALTAAASAIAAVNLPQKRAETEREKHELISFVLNTPPIEADEDYMLENGFHSYGFENIIHAEPTGLSVPQYYLSRSNNLITLGNSIENDALFYAQTTPIGRLQLLSGSPVLTGEEEQLLLDFAGKTTPDRLGSYEPEFSRSSVENGKSVTELMELPFADKLIFCTRETYMSYTIGYSVETERGIEQLQLVFLTTAGANDNPGPDKTELTFIDRFSNTDYSGGF